jgi:hypothetical protein
MSGLKVVRIPGGDYKVVTRSAGTITLDTGDNTGNVYITGSLTVMGTTTTVQSETLTVVDPIIQINTSETGAGVTNNLAGIQIDRGTEPDVSILFDESVASKDPNTGADVYGTFVFRDVDLDLKAIQTNSINTGGGNLALISDGIGIVTVSGTTNYEQQVLDYGSMDIMYSINTIARDSDIATIVTTTAHGFINGQRASIVCDSNNSFTATDVEINVLNSVSFRYDNAGPDIIPPVPANGSVYPSIIWDDDVVPNIRAVADLVSYTISSGSISLNEIKENDTKVQAHDFDTSGVSEINFIIDGSTKGVINSSGLTIDTVVINNNTVGVENPTDALGFENTLALKNQASPDTSLLVGYVKLYSTGSPGNGGTDLYFVNTDGQDELISKTKALLYSLIL